VSKADFVLAPDYLVPEGLDRVIGYPVGDLPDTDLIERVGFFVPGYIDHHNTAWLQQLPGLQVVQLPTVGYDSVLAHLPAGVTLCNAAGVHEQSTAELTVGSVIARWRGIDRAARDMTTGTWDHRRGRSLQGAQVLVIGAGGVGRAIADSFAPLGCHVTLVARSGRDGIVGADRLPELVPAADIVVLAVPLTAETTGMVDHAFLAQMRDRALLVNVARGSVVVTSDLLQHLGRIEAVLDVTEPEPLPSDHPLWTSPHVLITPHVGGDTDAFPRLARHLIAEQAHRWRSGQPLSNVIVAA